MIYMLITIDALYDASAAISTSRAGADPMAAACGPEVNSSSADLDQGPQAAPIAWILDRRGCYLLEHPAYELNTIGDSKLTTSLVIAANAELLGPDELLRGTHAVLPAIDKAQLEA